MANSGSGMRIVVRYGLPISVLLLAAALFITAWTARSSVSRASELIVTGQADAFLTSIRGPSIRRSNRQQLAERFDELRDEGLLHVAVIKRDGTVGMNVGLTAEATQELLSVVPHLRRSRIIKKRGLVYARQPFRGRGRQALKRNQPPPRMVVIVFDPKVERQLKEDARAALTLGAIAGLGLIVVAGLLMWSVVRREREARDIEQSRHLASLGEMSAVLAHEIKNPLASLKGNAQLLERSVADDPKTKQKAERVVSEATRLEKLTNDLLAFSKQGKLQITDNDPVADIEQIASELAADIEIAREGAPTSWPYDQARMKQVMRNLLSNAIEAGGPVRAEVAKSGKNLVIRVSDSGPGLPNGDTEELFEPFVTHKTQGTGLGLAVVNRLVRLHGGQVTAANHDDGGALFQVTLPGR